MVSWWVVIHCGPKEVQQIQKPILCNISNLQLCLSLCLTNVVFKHVHKYTVVGGLMPLLVGRLSQRPQNLAMVSEAFTNKYD
jgi:hypothetical protein